MARQREDRPEPNGLAAACGVLLAKDSGDPTGDGRGPPTRGGTVVVALRADIDSWNPYAAGDLTSVAVLDLLYPRLVVEMGPGDYVNIPAHKRHRVEWTTPDAPTVWLAVHYR